MQILVSNVYGEKHMMKPAATACSPNDCMKQLLKFYVTTPLPDTSDFTFSPMLTFAIFPSGAAAATASSAAQPR